MRALASITVSLSSLLLAAACGGGGGSDDPVPDAAPAPDAVAAPDAPVDPEDAAPAADATPTLPDADLADAAPADAAGPSCEPAPTCTGDLSGIGTGDFAVTFTLTTTSVGGAAVIAQRGACQHSNFWDLRQRPAGGFSLELDDGNVNYFAALLPGAANDGLPHAFAFCRKAGMVHAFIDGVLQTSMPAATNLAPGMAALQTGTSPCVGFDGTAALVGTVTDVCVGGL